MSARRGNSSMQSGELYSWMVNTKDSTTDDTKGTTAPSEASLFFRLKYGDNEEKIFNTNCSNICLTHAIRKVCRLQNGDKLDLISLNGQPAYIFQKPDDERAHCLVQSRESYIAAKVEVVSHSKLRHRFTPLLKDMEPYPEVLERLAQEEDPENYTKTARKASRRRTASTRNPPLYEAPNEAPSPNPSTGSRPNSRGWEVSRRLLRNKKLRAMSGGTADRRAT